MKIALATPLFAERHGTRTITETLASALVEIGHTVTVVTCDQGCAKSYAPAENSQVTVVTAFNFMEAWRQYRAHDAVMSIHPSSKLGWPAVLSRRRMLISHHVWYVGGRRAADLSRRALLAFAPNIACSQAVADTVPVACTAVLNGVRADLLTQRPSEGPRSIDLLFVGAMSKDKGADIALDVMAEYCRDVGPKSWGRVALVGPRSPDFDLDAAIAASGLPVSTYRGTADGNQVARFYGDAVITLVPYRRESFGLVPIEAMACGSCVIGAARGGLLESIGSGGILVPLDDKLAWLEACKRLIGSNNEQHEMQQNARAHLENFGPHRMATDYLASLSKG